MVQYYVSSTTEEDTNEGGGPRDWNSEAEDLVYDTSPADLEEDDVDSGLQQELSVNFVEDFHKYPRRSRKWSSLYSQNSDRARTLNSTYDEEKLKHPEIVNEMLMAANNEENSKYPDDESRLNPTYDEDDLKCLEEAKALSAVYDDYIDQSDQSNAINATLDEESLKYAEAPQGPTRSLFQEASPEFRIERNLPSNRLYAKQPKFLDPTKELAVSSAGSRRAFSPQRRQAPAALKTFGATRRLYSARSPLSTAEAPQSQATTWGEESEGGGAREVLKRTRNTLLKDLEAAAAASASASAAAASASASATGASREGASLVPARRESSVASQRRTRSISTSRTPSLPSSLRPSSSPRPQSAAAAAASGPQAAEDALEQSARRDLYMRYSYIPSWVFLARRHDSLFAKVLDYFFKHTAWPDFHRLPEAFRNVCAQYSVEAHHMKRLPGFAPVWLFALRRMDARYFRAAVDHFFDQRAFPHWSWLPRPLVRRFEELGIHERHYFA